MFNPELNRNPDCRWDLSPIHDRLMPYLQTYPGLESEDLQEALQETGSPIPDEEVLSEAEERINRVTAQFAQTETRLLVAETISRYPEAFLSQPLLTPSRYIRENGLSTDKRPALRSAYERTIKLAKEDLKSTIDDSDISEVLDSGLTDTELKESIEQSEREVVRHIEYLANDVESVLKLRSSIHISSTAGWLAVLKEPAAFAHERVDPDSIVHLHKTMVQLTELIRDFHGNKETVISGTVDQLTARIKTDISSPLYEYLDSLATEHADTLFPHALETEYRKAARQKRPTTKKVSLQPEPTLDIHDTESPQERMTRRQEIGTVQHPFESAPEDVPVTILAENGYSLVVFEAFSATARSVSAIIRRNKTLAIRLDADREYLEQLVLTGNDMGSSTIKRVRLSSDPAQGMSIYRYGNSQPNAHRLYFAKTIASRIPELMRLEYELDAATPTLIHLAETDKAHQLDIFKSFNVGRRQARAGGAGSI